MKVGIVVKYFTLFLTITVWLLSCNTNLLKSAYALNLISDDYRYGDLYRLSNLGEFKETTPHCSSNTPVLNQKNTHLYIIGDSFTEPSRLDSTEFGVGRYVYVHWDNFKNIRLDTSVRNIIILQSVERHIREHFSKIASNFVVEHESSTKSVEISKSKQYLKDFENAQNKVEERLEAIVFSSEIALWFKEKKAWFNHKILGRTNDQVVVTPDQKHLLFEWDIDSTSIRSSFNKITDDELSKMVKNINEDKTHFFKMGFDDVYLSLIPNKTSVVAPHLGTYNDLINRLQRQPNLNVPIINVWPYFSTQKEKVYFKSDSHWNCHGQRYWTNRVKNMLTQK